MAIKFVSKEKEVSKTSQAQPDKVTALVDALVDNKHNYDKANKLIKAFDATKTTLRKLIPADAAEEAEVKFLGTTGDAVFSAASVKRALTDVRAAHKALGDEVFYAIATISLKDLDKYLSEAEQGAMVHSDRTGARVCKLKSKEGL